MSDSPKRRAELLADTWQGDWTGGPASMMARRAAAYARRRRMLRRGSLALVSAAAVVMAIMVGSRTTPPRILPPPTVAQLGYEIISDDELVAQLNDRPLLVLSQENGSQKIVLLGR